MSQNGLNQLVVGVFVLQGLNIEAALQCGQPSVRPRDLARNGGNEVRPGSWPWQAYLSTGENYCGGVLITVNYVLTAAHCVERNDGRVVAKTEVLVHLGRHSRSSTDGTTSVQLRTVKQILVHPEFNPVSLRNDIAILTLADPAERNKFVDVVCVAKQLATAKSKCYATGFGQTGVGESNVLREINTTLMDQQSCKSQINEKLSSKLESTAQWHESMCCAGDPVHGAQDVCRGDSGGPLVCLQNDHWELQGLVSWGDHTCGKLSYSPGIYANVPHFYNWIRNHTGNELPQFTTQNIVPSTKSTSSKTNKLTTATAVVRTNPVITTQKPIISTLKPSNNPHCLPSLNGRQSIQLPNGTQMEVFCDGKTDGGGWLLIERRKSGVERFSFRSAQWDWLTFGRVTGDFWIGLDVLHMLTADAPMELLLDINWCDGKSSQLKYQQFQVGTVDTLYELHLERNKSDSDGEGLGSYNGRQFWFNSIFAAQHFLSGWWWNEKPTVSLHQYIGCDIPQPLNSFWFTKNPQRRRAVNSFEMKIRPTRAAISKTGKIRTPTPQQNSKAKKPVKRESVTRNLADPPEPKDPLRHCQEIYKLRSIRSSGVQVINLANGDLKEVFCEMTVAGGGWTVVQRRQDGKENFARNWQDYTKGFGNLTKDFWIGNAALNQLTAEGEQMELRLDMELCNGEKFSFNYVKFVVGSEEAKFPLTVIEEPKYDSVGNWPFYHSTELLTYNKGWEFATAMDSSPQNCVKQMGGGGWWYNSCGTLVNLNGKYGCDQPYPEGNFIYYIGTRQLRKARTVSMMLRPFDPSAATVPRPTPVPGPTYPIPTAKRFCHDYWLLGERQNGVKPIGLSVYEIRADVYCEMANSGGWTVLMRRTNGQESFQRSWVEYTNGFGSLTGDFWLGNRIISSLTHEPGRSFTTQVEVVFCGGGRLLRTYQVFNFDDEENRFKLSIYRDNAEPDELSYNSGRRFYTANLHNSAPNCGNTRGGGGWWWSSGPNCTLVNFTGKFGCEQPFPSNMYWQSRTGDKAVRTIKSFVVKMKPN